MLNDINVYVVYIYLKFPHNYRCTLEMKVYLAMTDSVPSNCEYLARGGVEGEVIGEEK